MATRAATIAIEAGETIAWAAAISIDAAAIIIVVDVIGRRRTATQFLYAWRRGEPCGYANAQICSREFGVSALWFSIVDWNFHATSITVDATKFSYMLTAIGSRYSIEVRDIIMNPPVERAYKTLKAELIKRLSKNIRFEGS